MQPRATRDDYDRAFDGLAYPAPIAAVIRKARDHGGIDAEVLPMLEQIPDRTFHSYGELLGTIHDVYAAQGVDEELIPV
jgi:hypothetical protein